MKLASAGLLAVAAALLASCATPQRDYQPDALAIMKRDFHAEGSAGMEDRKSTRLNSSHPSKSRMPSSA